MSDDRRRPDDGDRRPPGSFESEMDSFDPDEFGGPLFGATTEQPVVPIEDEFASERISFGSDDSGSLPHWTDPPTGEVPRIPVSEPVKDPTDDIDVWSSFASETAPAAGAEVSEPPKDPTGELTWHDDDPTVDDPTVDDVPSSLTTGRTRAVAAAAAAEPAKREPARITIGTDPSGMPRRPDPKRRGGAPQRPPSAGAKAPAPDGRNLPVAVASGLVLAAVFLGLSHVASGRCGRIRHGGARRCCGGVLLPSDREGLSPRRRRRCCRVRGRTVGCVLGRRHCTSAGHRPCLPRRCGRLHRGRFDRGRSDAEHGHHDARRRVDRCARIVRRTHPALVDLRVRDSRGEPTRWC